MNAEIERLVQLIGEEAALDLLRKNQSPEGKVLTIVADPTMHKIPDSELLGDVFFFSSGMLEADSDESLKRGIVMRLKALNSKLLERSWGRIRIVYSGHALLSAQIKLLVYRVTHLETEDVAFFGAEGYRTIIISMRGDVIE